MMVSHLPAAIVPLCVVPHFALGYVSKRQRG
jgi:hypothetical protein